MKNLITLFFIVMLILNQACRKEEDIIEIDTKNENTEQIELDIADWTEETHGNSVNPNYSIVFNQSEVLRFDIKIESSDWEIMQADLDANLGSGTTTGPGGGGPGGGGPGGGMALTDFDPVWVPCSFNFNEKEWYKVGIRFKGNSSLSSTYGMGIEKFSFKLDFDQFEDDYTNINNQRFYGFKQLNLKNNFDDASHMREKVGSDLFLDFGLASPQTAFCVVFVDYGEGPIYYGVYTLVEEVDDTVLDSQFTDGSGNLYKPDGDAASFASGTYNESEMEKKNNEDIADYSDVYSLYTVLNSTERSTDVEQWKSDLNKVFNVDIFLKWLAANTVMQNWDTYGNMTHNYYLYNNPDNNLLTWIPWDNNEALQKGKMQGSLSLSLSEVANSWPLIRYLIDIPEYEATYKAYLLEFINETFTVDRMTNIYSHYYNLLKEYAYAEVSGYSFLTSDAQFDLAVEELKNHVQTRNNEVTSYMK